MLTPETIYYSFALFSLSTTKNMMRLEGRNEYAIAMKKQERKPFTKPSNDFVC